MSPYNLLKKMSHYILLKKMSHYILIEEMFHFTILSKNKNSNITFLQKQLKKLKVEYFAYLLSI